MKALLLKVICKKIEIAILDTARHAKYFTLPSNI
ncbi:hypothetical protein T01_2677 [Trichinella spiralis]|uniref:Uncharacterized protein n=1 Tax=Trichinella spiralis TaxID=6334 RepID=A0A0V0ZCK3_TRISP|nr:hypothetical protein T01_2677 [Trichinella spiralis]